jgi:hypothetical protein
MDWLEFSASVIRSLAWPIAVIGGILILREDISSFVSRIKEFAAFGVKTKFAKGLKEGKEEAGKITISGAKPKIEPPLASDLPGQDVIDAFKEIEETLAEIRPLLDKPSNLRTFRSIVERLERESYIDTAASPLFNSLREARNAAAQSARSLSAADASEYQQQAQLLNDVFKAALKHLQANPLIAQPRPPERP